MNAAVEVARLTAACLAATVALDAGAQSLISTSGASLSIVTPTEAQYDAGVSNPSGNYTIVTACIGTTSAGCRLFLQYGSNPQGQQVGMEYAVVAIGSSDCEGVVANPNAWMPVQPASVVLSTAKNRTCVATFQFRVSPLSWILYQSPGPPGGSYKQRVDFVLTRP
jgi:hypothetical protein